MQIDMGGKKILDKSERFAQENRTLLDEHGVYMVDLLADRKSVV